MTVPRPDRCSPIGHPAHEGTVMPSRVPARADETVLREYVQHRLPAILGQPSVIASIRRRRAACSSSYDSDVVTVRLRSGEEFRIFLKNFGVTGFPKDGARQRRERERGVYQDLLADADLATATYYGSVWDEALGRFWLLLEFVNGSEVRFCEIDTWFMAAGWLGRLQRHFARQLGRVHACDFLVRHDARFFWSRAELASRDVFQISRPLAARLEKILDRYDSVVGIMASQPRTLVHGHYRPCNIIADTDSTPVRICPVDWEQAALGSPLYDLALLSDGFESPVLDRLLDAYLREAAAPHAPMPDMGDVRYIVDCFRMFMQINLLSRARERGFPEHKVARIIDMAERLRRVVYAESRSPRT
jgi:Phosphotransferase enzyme family